MIKTFPLSQSADYKIGVIGKTILVSIPGRLLVDNTIYRSVDNGTVYQVYRIQDMGDSWSPMDSPFLASAFPEFIVTIGNKIFYSQYNAFYESADGGLTWISRTDTPIKGGPFSLVKQNNVLYASPVLARFFLPGIYRSMDSGTTWVKSLLRWVEDMVHGDLSLFILAIRNSPQPKLAGDLEAVLYARPISELPASIRWAGRDRKSRDSKNQLLSKIRAKSSCMLLSDPNETVGEALYDILGDRFIISQK